mmetsp:Transcript_6769/g.12428  ORF Transcript_6769/g.12428 Transcript_6769/m.12428 type:complete len:575 (-) Transcript_6769:231-1955(-)|eukprot:CAMPEP_0197516798 /NCGR_PEP_ID=MMETSP1318-20131121/1726_1 /TAXON_ID=552666 /ORGANISM="Partenskyella glossopodia, Strain RCC365" /LENGTH=574 /DNA_ID=CAMNT_0043065827 /DNA_START=133 /DNA_END=1857 /DNA_ORIENTATION=-
MKQKKPNMGHHRHNTEITIDKLRRARHHRTNSIPLKFELKSAHTNITTDPKGISLTPQPTAGVSPRLKKTNSSTLDEPRSLLSSIHTPRENRTGKKINSPRIHVKGYHIGRTIGKGAFGKVLLATRVSGGQELVVKVMEKKGIDDLKRVDQIFGEMFILTSLRHKNVIQLYEVRNQLNNIILVMEYAEGGELTNLIEKHLYLSEKYGCRIFNQILDGLIYCHRRKVIHRDLKLENILLDSEGNIKIVDFGLSERLLGDAKLESVCGTPLYMSPELMQGKKYDSSTDVWSLGIVLYAMLCGFMPFSANNLADLSAKVCGGYYTIPEHLSDHLKDLIKNMLAVKPIDRLHLESIQNHPWAMTGIMGGASEESNAEKLSYEELRHVKRRCHMAASERLSQKRASSNGSAQRSRTPTRNSSPRNLHVHNMNNMHNIRARDAHSPMCHRSPKRANSPRNSRALTRERLSTPPHQTGEDSLSKYVSKRGLMPSATKNKLRSRRFSNGGLKAPGRRSPMMSPSSQRRNRWKSPVSRSNSSAAMEGSSPRPTWINGIGKGRGERRGSRINNVRMKDLKLGNK